MTLSKPILGLAILVSFILAVLSVSEGLQNSFPTPGLYIAARLLPPKAGGLELLAERLGIAYSIDAAVWFSLTLGAMHLLRRHKKIGRTESPESSSPKQDGDQR